MRKVILIAIGALLTMTLQAQSWQPEPWRKYLIDECVKADSVSTIPSVMGSAAAPRPYDSRLFRCVTGSTFIKDIAPYKKQSKSIFSSNSDTESMFTEADRQKEMEKIVREGYHTSDFVADLLSDLINVFIFKSK